MARAGRSHKKQKRNNIYQTTNLSCGDWQSGSSSTRRASGIYNDYWQPAGGAAPFGGGDAATPGPGGGFACSGFHGGGVSGMPGGGSYYGAGYGADYVAGTQMFAPLPPYLPAAHPDPDSPAQP